MAFLHVYKLGKKEYSILVEELGLVFFFLKQCNSFKQFQLSQDVLKIRQGFVNHSKVCPYWFLKIIYITLTTIPIYECQKFRIFGKLIVIFDITVYTALEICNNYYWRIPALLYLNIRYYITSRTMYICLPGWAVFDNLLFYISKCRIIS